MKAKRREGQGTRPLDPLRRAVVAASALVLALTLSMATFPTHAEPFTGYSDTADAPADVAAALESAKSQNKRVLVIFGANWCPDCRRLDGLARTGALSGVLTQSYVVVHADVGRFNKNLDLASHFGLDLKKGIPSIVVASADKGTIEVADGAVMGRLMKDGFFTSADTTLAAHFKVRD